MTETEWLTSNDPERMLTWCRTNTPPGGGWKPSDRQLRLFAVACCHRIWHLLTDDRSRNAVEVASKFCDGEATEEELSRTWNGRPDVPIPFTLTQRLTHAAHCCCHPNPVDGLRPLLGNLTLASVPVATQAALLRDIIGNPFRPVSQVARMVSGKDLNPPSDYENVLVFDASPSWLTRDALRLARACYEVRGQACGRCKGRGKLSCPKCSGEGCSAHGLATNGPCTAGDRCPDCYGTGRVGQVCERCRGAGRLFNHKETAEAQRPVTEICPDCHGSGRTGTGHLDLARLAVLADALEEAGCTDAGLLQHLRGKEACPYCLRPETCSRCGATGWRPLRGPHVRGCWAISLILNQE